MKLALRMKNAFSSLSRWWSLRVPANEEKELCHEKWKTPEKLFQRQESSRQAGLGKILPARPAECMTHNQHPRNVYRGINE
ncbi:uncharacterized protein LOC107966453 isoform X2 [Pan troglodytes]|uniref:uncharacterized protein LOC107966453 isoform X2 n=1 Tax=Pan troglodytes TaxID=9598 RepID=UPI003013642B